MFLKGETLPSLVNLSRENFAEIAQFGQQRSYTFETSVQMEFGDKPSSGLVT